MSVRQLTDFNDKFRTEELSLERFGSWHLSIRPQQLTFCSMVLSFQKEAVQFSEIGAAHSVAMYEAITHAESFTRDQYGAVRLNLFCLMMVDPIVHFHVFPRYEMPVTALQREWRDHYWPRPVVLFSEPETMPAPELVLSDIRTRIG